jgi:pimeloyl-ACP methyl ester carboxylesterase
LIVKARFPDDLANEGWACGTNAAFLEQLRDYWCVQKRDMNRFSHYRTTVEGNPIHFIHQRGRGPLPIILNHCRPWILRDMKKVIGSLSDPAATLPMLSMWWRPRSRLRLFDTSGENRPQLLQYGQPPGGADAGSAGLPTSFSYVGDCGSLITAQQGHKHAKKLHGIHVSLPLPKPSHDWQPPVEAPTGVAVFENEIISLPKSWSKENYNLQHYKRFTKDGHFAPMENPDAIVAELREFFRPLR